MGLRLVPDQNEVELAHDRAAELKWDILESMPRPHGADLWGVRVNWQWMVSGERWDGDRTEWWTFRATLTEDQILTRLRRAGVHLIGGCHCAHCDAGYDCCGRMFPYTPRIQWGVHRVLVTQPWSRNV